MSVGEAQLKKLLERLDTAWTAFKESYAGLPDSRLLEPGVLGDWSVKDILAHVTTWEEEALKHLPLIAEGGKPPRYVTYGGLDAFNARMAEQKRSLSLSEVQRQLDETHRRLVDFIQQHQGVDHTGPFHRLDDLPGHGADIGSAVPADLCFITNPSEGNTHQCPAERTRDRLREGCLANARRTDEAED